MYDFGRSSGLDWEPQQAILRDKARTTNRIIIQVIEIDLMSTNIGF